MLLLKLSLFLSLTLSRWSSCRDSVLYIFYIMFHEMFKQLVWPLERHWHLQYLALLSCLWILFTDCHGTFLQWLPKLNSLWITIIIFFNQLLLEICGNAIVDFFKVAVGTNNNNKNDLLYSLPCSYPAIVNVHALAI